MNKYPTACRIPLVRSLTGALALVSQFAAVSTAGTQAQPGRRKSVTVAIRDTKPVYSASATTSFDAGPKSMPTVQVHWNGYGFLCRDDIGRTFWQYSNDLAFRNRQSASFI